jgi:hypothetical protein
MDLDSCARVTQLQMAKNRQARALEEEMFVTEASRDASSCAWHLAIAGSKDSSYVVVKGPEDASCSCPDFLSQAATCKHMYFIDLRILELESPLSSFDYETDERLLYLLEGQPSDQEQLARRLKTQDCAICFEPTSFHWTERRYCSTCSELIHLPCLFGWFAWHNWQSELATCPLCLNPWATANRDLAMSKFRPAYKNRHTARAHRPVKRLVEQ